ncbi:4'-phosphopantetheinyl transferase family protein [Pseudochryseolinea flava]|uniref:4-phosphopantetheinyl transferase n=1 Tax=Pseudochryseolinea flava TaxID=2059302 RepID=A0A364XYR3_9BACT|nr:4'-phosphopantetheinyl transferase superfamily protein [Pseudochryseolinea flava]RAV99420.1 4-phosphopantetheinyl transferase [Pseudochryseolinea flava]
MPLEKIVLEQDRALGLWLINEDENALVPHLSEEKIPESFTNPNKRLEWLSARLLVKVLLESWGLPYHGIAKDDHGKPSVAVHGYHLSLSHSYPYVAALIDKHQPVGIDLEQPKAKLLRVGPRVLHPDELSDAGSDLVKHCIYWCSKEALIKFYGKKDLTLAENLIISPFLKEDAGEITGKIIVTSDVTVVPLYYSVHPNFVMVFNKRIAT